MLLVTQKGPPLPPFGGEEIEVGNASATVVQKDNAAAGYGSGAMIGEMSAASVGLAAEALAEEATEMA